MATVASVLPADGAVNAYDDGIVVAEITNATDLTLSLIELDVNGVSCTVANGKLECWNTKKISGGAIVDDTTDVFCGTLHRWSAGELATVTVAVIYNGTTLSTTTFHTMGVTEFYTSCDAGWLAFSTSTSWKYGSGDATACVVNYALSLCNGDVVVQVAETILTRADAFYTVAWPFFSDMPSAAVVGETCITDVPTSGTVRAWTITEIAADGLAQTWAVIDTPGAGLVAIPYLNDGPASAVVASQTLTEGPAAGIVYAVNRRNTVEIRALSTVEAAWLTSLGVTTT